MLKMQKYVKDIDETTGLCGTVGLGEDNEYYENNGFERREVEQDCNGFFWLAGMCPPDPPVEVKALNEWAYQRKCEVAYGGITVSTGSQEYLVETKQESISMINAVLATGAEEISWKVYQGEVPHLLSLTRAQCTAIFAFAFSMINAAFAVEGQANAAIEAMTEEQRADKPFIDSFKAEFYSRFAAINKNMTI